MTSSPDNRKNRVDAIYMEQKLNVQFFPTVKDMYSFYNTDKKIGLKEIKQLLPGSKARERQSWASDPSVSQSVATLSCFAILAVDPHL